MNYRRIAVSRCGSAGHSGYEREHMGESNLAHAAAALPPGLLAGSQPRLLEAHGLVGLGFELDLDDQERTSGAAVVREG